MEKKEDRTKGKRTNPTETGPHRNPLIDRLGRRRQSSRNVAEERQKKNEADIETRTEKLRQPAQHEDVKYLLHRGPDGPDSSAEKRIRRRSKFQEQKSTNTETRLQFGASKGFLPFRVLFLSASLFLLSFPRSFIFLPRSLALHTSPFPL